MSDYKRKGKKYSKITYKKRTLLIDIVVNKGGSITETSKKLYIKLPTAKAILSSYRNKNHVFQRKIEQENSGEFSQGKYKKTQKEKKMESWLQKNSEKAQQVSAQLKHDWITMMTFDPYQLQFMYQQMNWWQMMYGQPSFLFY